MSPSVFLLGALALLCSGCSDLDLRGALDRTRADSTAESTVPAREFPARRQHGSRIDPAVAAAGFSEIRGMLRRLVAAEETFFAENGSYTDNLSHLGLDPGPNVTIKFLRLTRDGWAASGSHASLLGRDCVIFAGQVRRPPTTAKYSRRGREGMAVCDELWSSPPQGSTPAARMPAGPGKAEPRSAPPADTANPLELLDPRVLMKVDLRNLAHSQETYFASQGSYARRTESLPLQYLWHKGVRLKILSADAESWSAEATHARLPGRTCVIWLGPVARRPVTQARKAESSGSGVPICD